MKLSRSSLQNKDVFGGLRELNRRARLSAVEIVALVGALAFAAVVAFFYFSSVQPLNSEVAALQARETELTARLQQMNTEEKKRNEQAANADGILASLRYFEAYLKPDQRGMTQIINEIDQLGKTHKVIIGDASYRVDESEQLSEESGQSKPAGDKQRIYPALGIDTVVIGEYLNLRRFLADLERSRQFLIINAVHFQGESDQVRRQANRAGGPKLQLSSPDAVPVSLKIEMDTYFQSPIRIGAPSAAKPLAPAVVTQ